MRMPSQHMFSCYLAGGESTLIQCAEILLQRGHAVHGIITSAEAIARWARAKGIPAIDATSNLQRALAPAEFDYFFSITNLDVIPDEVLALPRRLAINFHDGPLPRYAGLYTPAWALINQEPTHGITWHVMTTAIDQGDLLKQRVFPISADETSLTLNTRAYEAAIDSFSELVEELASGTATRIAQDRTAPHEYFGRHQRPAAACTIRWSEPASTIAALVRALDFGMYANPLGLAKVATDGEPVLVIKLEILAETSVATPGTIVAIDAAGVRIATGTTDVRLLKLLTADGSTLSPADFAFRHRVSEGSVLPALDRAAADRLTSILSQLAKYEAYWQGRLAQLQPVELPYANRAALGAGEPVVSVVALPAKVSAAARSAGVPAADFVLAAFAVYLARVTGQEVFDLGLRDAQAMKSLAGFEHYFASSVPLRVALDLATGFGDVLTAVRAELDIVRQRVSYVRDIIPRTPALRSNNATHAFTHALPVVIEQFAADAVIPALGTELTLRIEEDPSGAVACWWTHDPRMISARDVVSMQRQFAEVLAAVVANPAAPVAELPLMSGAERQHLLHELNATSIPLPSSEPINRLFEEQAARTPNAIALVFDDGSLTYAELNARANQLARHLRTLGVRSETLVGVFVERSLEMMVAVLAIHKAGGAYVPLDPAYPRDRVGYMVEDSRVALVLTQERLATRIPAGTVRVLLDGDWSAIEREATDDLDGGATGADLAYVIYTSGSTGKPKGVMVEHRNVASFFAGMDYRIGGAEVPGSWLAVTSLNFDISVLELYWTLCRGFKVVLFAEETARAQASTGAPRRGTVSHGDRSIDFSLFYFSSDESESGVQDKYRLLLEGAKYGDRNGFAAVWTPERHFHAFGGLYPNPSVTSAAIAAITERIGIRSGSCVLPLHHPIRVAEEWAVVDNISKGRVGLSFAAGWQPNDFVLRPENYKDAKNIMLRDIEVVRKLWRGESLTVTNAFGKEIQVRTLPRPIQPELPFWVTTAGNPETYMAAGKAGANVLTHLLGQTVDELEAKIAAYRTAFREAGHAGDGHVTLMLHSFVSDDAARVKETVRRPMIEYLRTSASLIKGYASVFPAFKTKVGNSGDANKAFESLTDEEMDAVLEFSFERYFETSGLFGTPESCVEMVDRCKGVGVDELACLIDFGIDSETVLANLPYLNELRERTGLARPAGGSPVGDADFSVLAQLTRHGITHLQCTPSMASMIAMSGDARGALDCVTTLMIGGEVFPAALAAELRALAPNATIMNMYGPTETTVWSATHVVEETTGSIPLGRPIANTELYVVDPRMQPLPAGVAGELFIGGAGVARGYLNRPELTAERFVADPFSGRDGSRLYRTGDLARFRDDGTVEFRGRVDFQVKLRGYRIELGEIETLIEQHPAVERGVVVVREDAPGDKRLVAYVTLRAGTTLATAELREGLRRNVPEFMVPAHVVVLDAMPLTPNAKIDRKALPAPEGLEPASHHAAFIAPANHIEETIARVYGEVLNAGVVGTEDNFFDMGGHSLLAVQAHRRLRDALRREFSIADLFRYPTVRGLAAYLASAAVAPAAGEGSSAPALKPLSREGFRMKRSQVTGTGSKA